MQRFLGFMFFLVAGVAVFFSLTNVQWQHHAIRDFVPVPVRLFSTNVRVSHGSKGSTSYTPEAVYSYDYQGKNYDATRVRAIDTSGSDRAWANDVLARIDRRGDWPGPEVGTLATAYIDPKRPQDSILVRDYSFMPYGFGMGSLVLATLGLGMLTGFISAGRTKMAAVPLDESGWQLLLPQFQLRKQLRNAVICLLTFGIAVLLMPAHWLLVAGQVGVATYVSGTLAAAVILLFAVRVFRRWSVARHVSDARLRVKPAPVPRGEPFAVQVGIDAYTPLRVTSFQAHVVCVEHYKEKRGNKTSVGTRTKTEKLADLCPATEVAAGQELEGKAEIVLEKHLTPTTDITVKLYPYYTWEIRLKLELEGAVDYAAVFPLEVD